MFAQDHTYVSKIYLKYAFLHIMIWQD